MNKKTLMILGIFSVLLIFSFCLTACESEPPFEETTASTVSEQSTAESAAPDTAFSETTDAVTAEPETAEPETAEPETGTSETALDGGFSTPDYTVSVINGAYYLNFTEENGEESGSHNGDNMFGGDITFLSFSSIAHMKQAFRENLLTESQQKIIQTHFTATDRGYALCNFDEMLCPVTPEGFFMDSVLLYGLNYTFLVHGPGELTAGVYLGDEGKYERQYDSFMEIISNHQLDSHTTETYDGVACESYVIRTNVAQIKYVFMTISTEGKVTPTRVIMRFLLRSQTQPDEVSDTVPRAVYVFGEDCGMPYDYLIHGVSEAPTVEWLSSFGLVPYEDDSSAAVS